jgi:hypothetical protein
MSPPVVDSVKNPGISAQADAPTNRNGYFYYALLIKNAFHVPNGVAKLYLKWKIQIFSSIIIMSSPTVYVPDPNQTFRL